MQRTVDEAKHPSSLDRNRSIIWARNMLQMPNWAILAVKSVPLSGAPDTSLVSVSIANSRGKIIFDALVRPDSSVTSQELRKLGLSEAELFRSLEPQSIFAQLTKLLSRREVLCWDAEQTRNEIGALAENSGATFPLMRLIEVCQLQAQYAGHLIAGKYEVQDLNDGSSRDQCLDVFKLIQTMASTSQQRDSAEVGNQNWTAAFFKPKLGPVDKIKAMFGKGEQ